MNISNRHQGTKDDIVLDTPRLILSTAIAVRKDLHKFFSPWESSTTESELDYKNHIKRWAVEFEEGRSIRFLLIPKEAPNDDVIGICNFTQIFRGPFQACYLGYNISASHEGKGLMSEALKKAIQYMFEEQKIHRVMANYMPSNEKSARLLLKLGFTIEGFAKDYLLLNGKWEDHTLASLINQQWNGS
jgi:ribosomal-protein-alanine N-acetyltransferase